MTFLIPSSSEKHAYNRASKIKIIKDAFLNVNESRIHRNELIVYCPQHYHHKPKLEINVENDIYHCWVCNYRGLVPKLLKEMSRIDLVALYMPLMGLCTTYNESVTQGILERPRGVYGAQLSSAQIDLIYAKTGLQKDSVIKGCIGISDDEKYKNRIVFPSFNKNGKLNYFTTRAIEDNKFKYISCNLSSKSIIFNELYINWDKPIILVESSKTHFKMIDYPNFVSILGSNFHIDSYLLGEMVLNGVKDVILMFDRDAANKQFSAAQILLQFGFDVRLVNDLRGANQPDELSIDDIISCTQSAQKVDSVKDVIKMKVSQRI